MRYNSTYGFTLIELSIVLVIIGLIVGGVLAGQTLISAATVRAQVTQIEKYNTAVNTFFGKYGYLPGDIPVVPAAQFGFAARGSYAGEGDGNGIIEGNFSNTSGANISIASNGESTMFWEDLSTVNLIDQNFNSATNSSVIGNITRSTSPPLTSYLPLAKIGEGNYIYVWSKNGINYYGLSLVTILGSGMASTPSLMVNQAYAIDAKTDDGLPQSGRIQAFYVNNIGGNPVWANGVANGGVPYTTAIAGSSTSCFDNGSGNTAQQYSLAQSGGTGLNCALSFQFQGGD